MLHGRLSLCPGKVKQAYDTVVKHIPEGRQAIVLVVAHTPAGILGQVDGKRPIRPEKPQESL